MAGGGSRNFGSIQVLRGVAAMMVVGLHAALQASAFDPAYVFPLGNAGVDIFFPISGFVMVVSTAGRRAGAPAAGHFALARLLRIAPIYWLVTLAKMALTALRPALAAKTHLTIAALAGAFLFIPVHETGGPLVYPPVKPGWTLDLEMFYYALIVAVLLFSRRIALYVPLLILAVVAVSALIKPNLALLSGEFGWGSPLALEFAAGMLIGQAALTTPWCGRFPWLAILAALGLYAVTWNGVSGSELERSMLWGAAGALLVWAAVGLERRFDWDKAPVLKLLGDASYSIYLTHALAQPILGAAAGPAINKTIGAGGYMALQVIIPTAAGVAAHLLVEKPLNRWIKRTLRPAAPATSDVTSAA